jgi:hypothetical protein
MPSRIAQGIIAAFALGTLTMFYVSQILSSTDPYPNQHHRISSVTPAVIERPDERVADYTYWLTIFTFGLFAVAAIQGYILIRAERVATRNADAANEAAAAAKRAAEATSEIDRAFVYLKTVEIVVARGPSTMGAHGWIEGQVAGCTFNPIWGNSGRTPTRRMLTNVHIDEVGPEVPVKVVLTDRKKPARGG